VISWLKESRSLNTFSDLGINKLECENGPVTWVVGTDDARDAYSYWGDDIWYFPATEFPAGTSIGNTRIRFNIYHDCFVPELKRVLFSYSKSGVRGSTVIRFSRELKHFTNFLQTLGLKAISSVNSLHCANYVTRLYQHRTDKGKPLSLKTIQLRLGAVEVLHQICVGTDSEFGDPWPGNNACSIVRDGARGLTSTPIPEDALKLIFGEAQKVLISAPSLINLNIEMENYRESLKGIYPVHTVERKLNEFLKQNGFDLGVRRFKEALFKVQPAVIIVILILTGMRIHEILFMNEGCVSKSKDKYGDTFYWIHSESTKTQIGSAEWMVPKLAADAVEIQERIARGVRGKMLEQYEALDETGDGKVIRESMKYSLDRLFLSEGYLGRKTVRPLSYENALRRVLLFVDKAGVKERYSPHQYRRTFAVYAAQSSLCDIRYLKQHFKHWSMDMTLAYAHNPNQDLELIELIFAEISSTKKSLVSEWLSDEASLAGGTGNAFSSFRNRNDPVRTFSSRAELIQTISSKVSVRATGNGWCTADTLGCLGPSNVDTTRCFDCTHSVIDKHFVTQWKRIYLQQTELLKLEDIGLSGRDRVKRDLVRCELVLKKLGVWKSISKA